MGPINNREELALDTINQVQLAIKSTGVYPQDHPITGEIINRSYESLVSLLNGQNRLDVSGNGGKLLVDDVPVESKNNFARALRTFLRQDPDVIMVGEIRDLETAEIAFKAALTGHLVVSTLHTNDAPETINRLLNIGVEPYMIASPINLIVAQRLLRKICDKCKVKAAPTDLQANVIENYGLQVNGNQFFQGEGCQACSNTGYKGRLAVYEVMPMWEEIQELILKGESIIEIRKKAEKLGLTSLQTQGFNQVAAGVTSLNEWMRVLA